MATTYVVVEGIPKMLRLAGFDGFQPNLPVRVRARVRVRVGVGVRVWVRARVRTKTKWLGFPMPARPAAAAPRLPLHG